MPLRSPKLPILVALLVLLVTPGCALVNLLVEMPTPTSPPSRSSACETLMPRWVERVDRTSTRAWRPSKSGNANQSGSTMSPSGPRMAIVSVRALSSWGRGRRASSPIAASGKAVSVAGVAGSTEPRSRGSNTVGPRCIVVVMTSRSADQSGDPFGASREGWGTWAEADAQATTGRHILRGTVNHERRRRSCRRRSPWCRPVGQDI